MIDRSSIHEHMEVLTSDGVLVGKVEGVGTEAIKLTQQATPGAHHYIPLDFIARVDRHVHLNRTQAQLGDPIIASPGGAAPVASAAGPRPTVTAGAAGVGLGSAGIGAAAAAGGAAARKDETVEGPLPPVRNPAVSGARPRGNYYLPWVLGALLLLVLLFAMLRGCDDEDRVERTPAAADPAAVTTTRDTEGQGYAPGTIAYDLSRFLASEEPAPRTFTFDRLNFDTNSAGIRQQDVGDIDQLAQVMAANPRVRIAIVGYTDARGSGRRNARLGQERADAVAEALAVRGIVRDRLEARSGGESTPVARNDREGGQAENRRTELIVLSR